MKLKASNLAIAFILLLILVTRLPLFNPAGRFFFGDEIFYKRLVNTLKESEKINNPLLFPQGVFGIYAKPGYGIFYSFPIWLEAHNPDISFGAILNLVINFSIVLLILLIVKRILNTEMAVLATITTIFSISSVIYLRHMLPYDTSLAILLLALYLYLRTNSAFVFGLAGAVSFITYPSYFYYLVPIPLLLFIFNKFKPKYSLSFAGGFAAVIILTQLVSLLIGAKPSYFDEARHLSGIVTQGDFTPAINFLKSYISAYDGVLGLVLAVFAPFVILLPNKKKFMPLFVYLVVIFLILETFSDIVAKTVLYGRTVRPFYLLLLITGTIALFGLVRKINISRFFYATVYTAFIFVVLINWWPRFNAFKDLSYPQSFRVGVENYLKDNGKSQIELEDLYTKKETIDDKSSDPPIISRGKSYIVNATLLYPYYGKIDVPCRAKILMEREHALLFKPYHYEGFTTEMRGYLVKDPPKYQLIYCE